VFPFGCWQTSSMAVCVFCQRKEIGSFPLQWVKVSLKLTTKKKRDGQKRAFGGGVNWVCCNSLRCKEAMQRFHKLVLDFGNNVEGGVRENLRSRKA
jgi:hypothetical protein